MKKLTKIILAVFVLALVLNSCKEPEEKTKYTYRSISVELKAYAFRAGSYWIYQDSTLGSLDTVTLYLAKMDSIFVAAGHPQGNALEVSENIAMYFKASFRKEEINQQIQPELIAKSSNYHSWCNYGSNGQWVYSPLSQGDTSKGLNYLGSIGQLTDNGNTYNDVKKFKIIAALQDCYLVDNNTTNYFCPNKGIVRYEIDSAGITKVWKLIDSHVIAL